MKIGQEVAWYIGPCAPEKVFLHMGQYAKQLSVREEQRRPKWREQQCHFTFVKSYYGRGININKHSVN